MDSSDENSLKDNSIGNDILKPNQIAGFQDKKELNTVIFDERFEKGFKSIFSENYLEDIPLNEEEEQEIFPPNIPDEFEKNEDIHPTPDEKIVVEAKDQKDKYFPFNQGYGLDQVLKSIGLTINYKSSSKISLLSYNNQLSNNSNFRVTQYYVDENGKKKKKKKRKFKPDDIRKKIKAKFHKVLKNVINSKLKKAGAKKMFDFFPQCFITNITININKEAFDLTYEELIRQDYSPKNNKRNTDFEKYYKNLDVLNYLNQNPEIKKLSEFDKISKMKYEDIFKAYFLSFEFEQTILELFQKKEKIDYIEEYVSKALTYVNFFINNKKKALPETIYYNNNTKSKIHLFNVEEKHEYKKGNENENEEEEEPEEEISVF